MIILVPFIPPVYKSLKKFCFHPPCLFKPSVYQEPESTHTQHTHLTTHKHITQIPQPHTHRKHTNHRISSSFQPLQTCTSTHKHRHTPHIHQTDRHHTNTTHTPNTHDKHTSSTHDTQTHTLHTPHHTHNIHHTNNTPYMHTRHNTHAPHTYTKQTQTTPLTHITHNHSTHTHKHTTHTTTISCHMLVHIGLNFSSANTFGPTVGTQNRKF